MDSVLDPLIGRELGGCRILERLGQGGMGTVYKAHHHRLDRMVAVKILPPALAAAHPEAVERFTREARAAARMEHPRIVQVYDVGSESGLHYIVMQFIDGETLAELIARKRRLGPAEAYKIMRAVLEGLAEAHARGMVHHDVKPSNILLGKDGSIRLADFGIAMPMSRGGKLQETMLGTPAFMAPEAASGVAGDARSDLYAAGVTYFHMLAGRPPYESDDMETVIRMQINDPLPNVRRLNPAVTRLASAVVAKLMAKRPQDRYQSAEKAMLDLDAPGVVIGELDAPAQGPEDLPPDIAAEPEFWYPGQAPGTPLNVAPVAAPQIPEFPSAPARTLSGRMVLSVFLNVAAAALAFLAGARANWALGAAALAGSGGGLWASPRRDGEAEYCFAAAAAAAFIAGVGSSLSGAIGPRDLALWIALAFAAGLWATRWRLLSRFALLMWTACAIGFVASLYVFALPDPAALSQAILQFDFYKWALLSVGVAVALEFANSPNPFVRQAPKLLLLGAAFAAYVAGVDQWQSIPRRAPAPPPLAQAEPAAEEPAVEQPPAAAANPNRGSSDQIQPLVHDDWDPETDTMNWSFVSDRTSARMDLPIRAFIDGGGIHRAAGGAATILCLLGLGLLFEEQLVKAVETA